MRDSRSSSLDPVELRQSAERRVRDSAAANAELTPVQQRELVYELQVYQSELEIQNDALREAHHDLERARDRLQDLYYESAPAGYLSVHRDGHILEANQTLRHMLGLERGALRRHHFYRRVAPEDKGAFFAHRRAVLTSGEQQSCELRLLRGDGSEFEAYLQSNVLGWEYGQATGFLSTISDITAQRAAERGWRLADAVVEASREGILVLDNHYRIVRANRSFTRLTGFALDVVRGHRVGSLLASGVAEQTAFETAAYSLEHDAHWSGELWLIRHGGEPFPAQVSMTVLSIGAAEIQHFAFVFADVTEYKNAAQRLHHAAYYDLVTGLPNRALFIERLAQYTKNAMRQGDNVALLFIDLNRFKPINDDHGHSVGDRLLHAVGARLSKSVRENDTVARIGGDEFAILLSAVANAHAAAIVAKKIHAALATPIDVDSAEIRCSVSIGIALYPSDTDDLETLYRYADLAMYRAKDAKRGASRFFAESMNAEAAQFAGLERELDVALAQGQFVLYYQPIFAVASGAIAGAEALLRWHHPEHGLISPGRLPFLPVAEETGQIGPIGGWVLSSACQTAAGWDDGDGQAPFVSINVSPQQLMDAESFETMAALLAKATLPPARIAIEITENAMVKNDSLGADRLAQLRRLGTHLAIDDFGTGYASLSALHGLPFDLLKIDQSFIRDLDNGPDSAHLVEATISMAHALRLKVIAEGVETPAQLAFLREQGCDYAQGYLLGHPIPQAEFESLLDQ